MSFKYSNHDEKIALRGMGEAIRLNRQRQGVSLGDLSKKADIAESELLEIEAGEISTSWGALRRIAYSLELTLPQLIQEGEQRADGL